MAGKHRKHSEVRTTVAKRGGSGVAAAALSITGLSTAVVTGTTAAVAPNVQLMALVSAANSTSQFFAGSSYYGTDWKSSTLYGGPSEEQEVVPFFRGPQGLAEVINGAQDGPNSVGVTGSGWGAGQAGTALGILDEQDFDFNQIGIVILDNNTNRAGGGFWTTYYPFAPLLFTSAEPTPNNIPGLTVLDVGYEYNINGDAPVDPTNPFAIGNSLAAYAFGYGAESRTVQISQATPGATPELAGPNNTTTTLLPGHHYVVRSDGSVISDTPLPANSDGTPVTTTYVTVDSGNLPLTRPLRLIPGGDIIANAIDPLMSDLVDAGYNDGLGTPGNPAIPANPAITRPMKPFSSLSALGADDVQDDIEDGATAGATTAFQNIGNPANFITKPIGEIAKLPGLSTLTNSSVSGNSLASANKTTSGPTAASTGSNNESPRPLQKAADDFNLSLKKFAQSLKPKAAEPKGDDDTE